MNAVEHFSGFEVIRAAMEVEKRGYRFYTALALKARSELIREIFTWLAQDEVAHLRTLEKLVPKYRDGAFFDNEEAFIPYLQRFREKEVFPSVERIEEVLHGDDPDLKAVDLAIAAEESFADYFRQAAARSLSAEGKEAFTWLADEEESHAAAIRDRRARLLASRQA